jgi:hypothetical protein
MRGCIRLRDSSGNQKLKAKGGSNRLVEHLPSRAVKIHFPESAKCIMEIPHVPHHIGASRGLGLVGTIGQTARNMRAGIEPRLAFLRRKWRLT